MCEINYDDDDDDDDDDDHKTIISGSQCGDYHLVKITYSSENSTTIFEAPLLDSRDDINRYRTTFCNTCNTSNF